MNDRTDPNLILGYVEGELPADERRRVEAMLAEDAALGDLVRGMQADREALRRAAPAEPPRDLADAALATLERSMLLDGDVAVPSPTVAAPVNRFRLAPLLTYGGIAAVLAITTAVVVQSLQSDRQPASSSDILAMEEPGGVGLAEAPIAAQREFPRAETLAAADEAPEPLLQDSVGDESIDAESSFPGHAAAAMGRDAEAAAKASNETEAVASAVAGGMTAPRQPESLTPPSAERLEGRARMAGTDIFGDSSGAGGFGGGVAHSDEALARVDAVASDDAYAAGLAGRRNTALYADASEPEPASFFVRAEANPRYTVNVYTRSADQTLEQLNTWAVSNSVAFAEDPAATAADPAPADGFGARAQPTVGRESKQFAPGYSGGKPTDGTGPNAAPARQQVVLMLAPGQVDDLVNELNRDRVAQNALVKDNAPRDVLRFAHTPQAPSAAAQPPEVLAAPGAAENSERGAYAAADSNRAEAAEAPPAAPRGIEVVDERVLPLADVVELDADAMIDAAVEASEEREEVRAVKIDPARGRSLGKKQEFGLAEATPAERRFDNRYWYGSWWDWAEPVAVEVVIEETPDTLPGGPLRLDAESP